MKKIEYLIKHNRLIQFLYKVFFSFVFKVFSFFTRIDNNLILISSYSGKKFNDSPKKLYEEIKNRYGDKYRFVWAFLEPDKFKELGLETVKLNSFKYFRMAFRAKYWITNVNIERGLSFKKKKQVYLNTWHGTGPKTIGNAVNKRKDYNFKKINYLCSDGEYLKDIFVKNFNARPESVLLSGRPREDFLYKDYSDRQKEMAEKYGITKDDFVILYAPTWREHNKKDLKSTISIDLDVDSIFEKIPNCKIIFKKHSITDEVLSNGKYDRLIDASNEPDIADLFLITDVLITDYSSSNLDIAILDKPFICFAPDYDEYTKDRPLCFDLKIEYPFGVQYTTDEVIDVLNKIRSGDARINELRSFKKKYGPYGGNATNVCIEKLFGSK